MGTVRVEMLLGAAKTEELAALQRFIDFMQEQINSRCKYCGSFAIVRNGKEVPSKGVEIVSGSEYPFC